MTVLYRRNGIRYEKVDRTNWEEAARCVARVFSADEPLVTRLGITEEEMFSFTGTYYQKIAEEGLSILARDQRSSRVIGARISEDAAIPPRAEHVTGFSRKLRPVFACLETLHRVYQEERMPEPGECVHMFMVAVERRYTNRGIAPQMNHLFFEMVARMGYRHLVTEPTGAISQHLLRDKLGFRVLHCLAYDDFEYEGLKIFAGMPEHPCIMLMEKTLEIEKNLKTA